MNDGKHAKKLELGDVVDDDGNLLLADGPLPHRKIITYGWTTVRWEQAHRASKYGWQIARQIPDLLTHVQIFRHGPDWHDEAEDAPVPPELELV
jgi:hypothetical protein